MNWQKLPKIELHRHLDGSIRFDTIIDLAQKNNIDLGVNSKEALAKKVILKEPLTSLAQVLDCFWTSQKVLANYEAIKRVTFENIEDAYFDGVKLIELRFAPTFIQKNKNLAFDEIIEAVIDGMTKGLEKYHIEAALIHIMPRTLDEKLNKESTNTILKYKNSYHKNADRLVGIDLADAETDESFEIYGPTIKEAKKSGLGVTIHSGEDTTAAHVKKSIEVYGADRIGHGIQIAKDSEIIKFVKERDVCLEVCPTSNWLTNCVKTLDLHPLKFLFGSGVSVTLNSDDPHIMNINLIREYEIAGSILEMSTEDLVQMNKVALKKSFIHHDLKEKLKKEFSEFR